MSNPTTPFSWQMPQSTDLVTDLPADFEVFGQAVATSMADLLGGTTGQILSKTSGTDMDFTWIANDQGDITNIGVTAPINGGGSSGSVTIGINDATTSVKGAVQLSDSTSTTSSVLAATPTAVKSAYDLANGAIPKTLTTTTGDVIYASAANTPARLGVGSTGNVLTVAGGVPTWAAPAGGGKVLQVVGATTTTQTEVLSSTFTDSTLTATITPTLNTSKILVLVTQNLYITGGGASDQAGGMRLMRGATEIFARTKAQTFGISATSVTGFGLRLDNSIHYLDSPATTSATTYKTQVAVDKTASSGVIYANLQSTIATIILLEIGA